MHNNTPINSNCQGNWDEFAFYPQALDLRLILPDCCLAFPEPKTSQKKDKQKVHVTDDKQVKNQSTMANPDAKTLVKNSKKASIPEATQILTGYEAVGDEQERIRDIIVYDIPYTWDLQKIIAELKF
ncbi:hypothetical protein RhiirA1_401043 [Rhizophagus irregularis]|uniref:Uncharacterized protein n=1 Tax=Rhizophagus irregularis TaxID=588596 RepID=A0A2I1F972_9GLOM|nr:hypothetical protein RhiirA1_401043 [Rhizophagus irregularis]PKY30908.1 hypothetical protein RhiirB3_392922 [Rhizophagus irregularis]